MTSLTKVDQQQQTISSSSIRRSSLIVSHSQTTKKRSSISTSLSSSPLTGSDRVKFNGDLRGRRSFDVNDLLLEMSSPENGSSSAASGGTKVGRSAANAPQSAPPTLAKPSYKSYKATDDDDDDDDREFKSSVVGESEQTVQKIGKKNNLISSLLIIDKDDQDSGAAIKGNSKEDSPEPIVEVKHTSSSASPTSSPANSSASSSDCETTDSRRLIRRRTVRRYHRATEIEEEGSARKVTSLISTSTCSKGAADGGVGGGVCRISTTTETSTKAGDCAQECPPELGESNSGLEERRQQQVANRGQFRTRQIGAYDNQLAKQRQLESSSTTIAAANSSSTVTTNRKSTTKRRQLISSTANLSTALHHSASSASVSKSRDIEEGEMFVSQRNPNHQLAPAGGLPAQLELRLADENQDSNQMRAAIERREEKQEEEDEEELSSSVHHRQSFSSSSMARELEISRKAAAISRSSTASREATHEHLSSCLAGRGELGADLATTRSTSSSSTSRSRRHFESVIVSNTKHKTTTSPKILANNNNNNNNNMLQIGGPFLRSSSGIFSSPDVRSLVEEIGTDFAELENALVSSTSANHRLTRNSSNSSASSLSSRLFGRRQQQALPLFSPLIGPDSPANDSYSTNTSSATFDGRQPNSESSCPNPAWSQRAAISSTRPEGSKRSSPMISSVPDDSSTKNGEKIQELLFKVRNHNRELAIRPRLAKASQSSSSSSSSSPSDSSPPLAPSLTSLPAKGGEKKGSLEPQSEKANTTEESAEPAPMVVIANDLSCKAAMSESIERIDQRMSDLCKKFDTLHDTKEAIELLKIMIQMIEKAWSVPVCGDDLGFKLCSSLRAAGGLDIILGFIQSAEQEVDEASNQRGLLLPLNCSPLAQANLNSQTASAAAAAAATTQQPIKATNETLQQQQQHLGQSTSALAKNNGSPNPLRLNLSKVGQPTIDELVQCSADSSPQQPQQSINNDSDIITSDLGLDSTSVDSLSYVSAAQAPECEVCETDTKCPTDELEPVDAGERDKENIADRPKVSSAGADETEEELESQRQDELQEELVASERDEEEEDRLRKEELVFLSARLLSQCLTSENRNYIVHNGLRPVIKLACQLITLKSEQIERLLLRSPVVQTLRTGKTKSTIEQDQSKSSIQLPVESKPMKELESGAVQASEGEQQQQQQQQQMKSCENGDLHAIIGTEILQHLFKHSEDTCSRIISLGGLRAILYGCRASNVEILRHCASALANLALYGGSDSQQTMIEDKAHVWLFPLAFHEDDNVQYYACLAIVVLAANQEIEADVLKSSTLDLVEPFVTNHEPRRFAKSTTAHIHGQSSSWLRKLIPLLDSKREEARNLASFHFAMEAYIKREQGQTSVFKDIGALEPLRKVGSSPIALAAKFACQALRLIGEKEPHKLSQQVPLWTSEDVMEWVSQIGFERFRSAFVESRVDGDLLLQLDDEMLRCDIGIENGIIRRRFLRELANLKRIADYSSVDKSQLVSALTNCSTASGHHDLFIHQYIYPMVQLGVTRDNIHLIDSEQLLAECRVTNTIHRCKLTNAVKELQERLASQAASQECNSTDGNEAMLKTLDVFVSYRRSNGSQLASLLKVHLQLRGFTVFIDVERLEAGKFDNNLLDSIKTAKNFILVLSPNALDRCIGDLECKDWVHKEIVAALASNCNIIPIMDNFHWPDPEQLPEDMRSISYFNGVRWIHDYQDACVDKVERFIRGEINNGNALLNSTGLQTSSGQSSLQRGCAGGGLPLYAGTPSIAATPLVGAFPNSATSAGFATSRFDADHHPLSASYTAAAQQQQHLHGNGNNFTAADLSLGRMFKVKTPY